MILLVNKSSVANQTVNDILQYQLLITDHIKQYNIITIITMLLN